MHLPAPVTGRRRRTGVPVRKSTRAAVQASVGSCSAGWVASLRHSAVT